MSFQPDEIKTLRQALGKTFAEFASKFSLSQSLVAYWETGIGTFFPCQFHANIL